MAIVEFPLSISYDTRDSSAYASVAKDQRRVNCYYEVPRPVQGQQAPAATLVKRPGCTDSGNTYGSTGQTQYLVCQNPSVTWATPTPWVFTKDGSNNIKVHDGSTSTTILTSADYYPRFVQTINISGTQNVVVQLQNTASPEGAPSQRVYYSAAAIATWTEITDADFTALKLRGQMIMQDGYAFIATGNGRIYQPSINALGTWAAGDYVTKQLSHDTTQGLMACGNRIVLCGRETLETFTNTGNAAGSVLSTTKKTARIGLAGAAGADGTLAGKTHYYAELGQHVFFAGRYGGHAGSLNCISYNGEYYTKISTGAEDKILSSTDIYGVYKVTFMGKIAIAFQTTAPGAATAKALLFFPESQDWFECESTVFSTTNNGVHYLGTNGQKLHHFPISNNYQDASTNYDVIVQFRYPRSTNNFKTMHEFSVVADNVSSNNLSVQWSDDDGANFTTARTIDLGSKKKRIHRCGTFTNRLIRLTHTASGELRLHRIYADVEEAVQ